MRIQIRTWLAALFRSEGAYRLAGRLKPAPDWLIALLLHKGEEEVCGATEWAPCDDDTTAHVYRVCTLPVGHEGRYHTEMWQGRLWAQSSGDDGPVTLPWCVHTERSVVE